jgi:hypothetical protein
MRNKLYWITVGGLSFWLPAIVINDALNQKSNLWTLNVVPLASLALLDVVSWIVTKRFPKWGWALAGIYILGPVCMLGPLTFAKIPTSPADFGGTVLLMLLCLFPPTTLWFSVLNGMIFSVLIATVTLLVFWVRQIDQGFQHG